MGKIKIKTLGMEDVEKQQKEEAKRKREQKQLRKAHEEVGSDHDDKVEVKPAPDDTTQQNEVTKENVKTEIIDNKKGKKKSSNVKVRSKKYLAAKKQTGQKKYSLKDAISLILSLPKLKFDESIELHLTVADKGIKGDVSLPHGTGKALRVAVVDDSLIAKLDSGVIDFDVLITSPAFMPKLVKFAKLLGPKGLMPNPKQGTVTDKIEEAVKKFSAGLLYYKTEPKFPLLHLSVGKKSFKESQIIENIKALTTSIGKQKIKSAHISSTMSPSVELDIESI